VAQSLLFTWRRLARAAAEPRERDGSTSLPVEIDATARCPPPEAARPPRPATSRRRTRSGVIEIELCSGNRVRVDNDVDADARRRVLSVLGER
jgi:transposase